jgi:tetratricopeptide (TPR) repeat protein
MRIGRLGLILLLLAGCGKNSADAPPSANTSPVPLAIPGPQPDAAPKKSLADWPPEIRTLLQRANAAVTQGRHATAIESLSQAIGIRPDDATLFRMRGDVYALIRENANARADFSTAIRLQPKNPELYNFRGYFLLSLGLGKEALADFDQAILLAPTHTAALNNRGLLKLSEQDYDAAEADFSKAIESNEKFADAWNNRGFARFKKQQLEPAMNDIRQALKLNENYVTAWNNRGLIAMQQQNFPEAVQAFGRAAELEPLDLRWITHRRAALLKMERFSEAQADAARIEWINALQQAATEIRRSPNSPDPWLRRGQLLMQGKEFAAAAQDFTRVLLISPKLPAALTARARCWNELRDSQKAMQDCDEAITAGAGADALSLRGDLWKNQNDLDRAIADYEAAQRFDSDVAQTYEDRAQQRTKAGLAADADADIQQAKRIRDALAGSNTSPSAAPPEADDFNPNSPQPANSP